MDKITLKENIELSPEEKRTRRTVWIILVMLFITIIILNISEGYMKIDEHMEYARQIENANITAIIAPLMLLGATYTFLGTCMISIIMTFVKKIDLKIKRTIQCLPIYVIMFCLPASLATHYIVQIFNIV